MAFKRKRRSRYGSRKRRRYSYRRGYKRYARKFYKRFVLPKKHKAAFLPPAGGAHAPQRPNYGNPYPPEPNWIDETMVASKHLPYLIGAGLLGYGAYKGYKWYHDNGLHEILNAKADLVDPSLKSLVKPHSSSDLGFGFFHNNPGNVQGRSRARKDAAVMRELEDQGFVRERIMADDRPYLPLSVQQAINRMTIAEAQSEYMKIPANELDNPTAKALYAKANQKTDL